MMSKAPNTVFLRLEGSLQAWGDNSKFVIRRTMQAPTKSGVLGMVCCAMGVSRKQATDELPALNGLVMGVRVDRPGTRWWDYQTVGAGIGLLTAGGGLKTGAPGTLVTRREYLCDASFLVALQGEAALVGRVAEALERPAWPTFLGRKCCPPTVPILADVGQHVDLDSAMAAVPWRPRYKGDALTEPPACILEWRPSPEEPEAPPEAEVWYDRPVHFDPPVHEARLVVKRVVEARQGDATLERMPSAPRPRANYRNTEYRKARAERLNKDHGLCVFCKQEATTVQHVTYRRAGGREAQEDLRSLCRLCHDAVTMIEYGLGMGLDRIDPVEARWRGRIIEKRNEILELRSEETRRRALRGAPRATRAEVLEQEEG